MGAAHGVMGAPLEGTAKDVRYTRSKDYTTLYATLLGWEKDQKQVTLTTLTSDRIDLKNLKSVELINGEAGKYLPLNFKQDTEGLIVSLPERSFQEMAYVLKLNFDGKIPPLGMSAQLDCSPHYYIVPRDNGGSLALGSDLTLTGKRKDLSNQWKLESEGKGIYKIMNRENDQKVLEYSISNKDLAISDFAGKDNQLWKIDDAHNELLKIYNKQFPNLILSLSTEPAEGIKAELLNSDNGSSYSWKIIEVCELKQDAYKPHTIPGSVEAEDYDAGCEGDAYYDSDDINQGGQYRPSQGVDIEQCSAGGYNVGWTNIGDWMDYTVNVNKTATYEVSFLVASFYDSGKFHLESDGVDRTGVITVPNTKGFQNWTVVKKSIKLNAGQHILKFVVDGNLFNIDKIVFDENN
jgi:hypothetical protein